MENLTVAPGGLIQVLDKLLIYWGFHASTKFLSSLRMVVRKRNDPVCERRKCWDEVRSPEQNG